MPQSSNTKVHGFSLESTRGTDPINAIDYPYWEFGGLAQDFEFGMAEHKWKRDYYNDSRDPSLITLVEKLPDSTIAFLPVNGAFLYYFLGNLESDVGGVRTVNSLNTGALPALTYRWEDKGGDEDEFASIVGNVVENVIITGDFSNQQANPLAMAVGLAGLEHKNPTLNSAHNGPEFPTSNGQMGGTQINDLYKHDSNMSFIWDQGGSNDDYTDELSFIQFNGINILRKITLNNSSTRHIILEGKRIQTLSFSIARGVSQNIYNDFLTGTKHNARFKIYNTASNYIQLDFSNVGLAKPTMQHTAKTKESDNPQLRFECEVTSLTAEIKDGIHSSYYS